MKPAFQCSVLAIALASTISLGGCMSMSGLDGDSKYACKAPEGVACDSVSGTYANAVANNLPSQRKRQAGGPAPAKEEALPRRSPAASKPLLPTADGAPSASADEPGLALRSQARYLRLWIKPWEDLDGDLYDQAHVYVQVDQGRWQIDHLQQRIRDASAPLRPPANASANSTSSSSEGGTTSPARPDASSLPSRQPLNLPNRGFFGADTGTPNREVTP